MAPLTPREKQQLQILRTSGIPQGIGGTDAELELLGMLEDLELRDRQLVLNFE